MSSSTNSVVRHRLEARKTTENGKILYYLASVSSRTGSTVQQLTFQALRAFYLPYVFDQQPSEDQVKTLARTAIMDLLYRIVQIQTDFLPGEPLMFQGGINPAVGYSSSSEDFVPAMTSSLNHLSRATIEQYLDDF